eukprot:gene6535-3179_t
MTKTLGYEDAELKELQALGQLDDATLSGWMCKPPQGYHLALKNSPVGTTDTSYLASGLHRMQALYSKNSRVGYTDASSLASELNHTQELFSGVKLGLFI